MTNPLISSNFKSPHLNSLATNFDSHTKSQRSFIMPEIIDIKDTKDANITNDNTQKNTSNKTNWGYLSGVVAAVGQITAGVIMIPAAFISKRKNKKVKAEIEKLGKNITKEQESEILGKYGKNSYICSLGEWLKTKGKRFEKISEKLIKNPDSRHLLGQKLNQISWKVMGASWLAGIPSCIGASLNVKQASMLSGSLLWLVASPLMMMKKFENSARLIGFSTLGYGFMYAGMANKVKNETELKNGEAPRVFDFKQVNKNNFFSKTAEFLKFVAKDLSVLPETGIKTVSQIYQYATGKRKETPEFWTTKPTENNSRLASLLLLPGSLLLMAFGKKSKPVEKIANILIGTGLLSEALYMYTLGNSQKGKDKAIILSGVPLRAVGDFGQTNPLMLGMRTIGGASFEYYFAILNKKAKPKEEKTDLKA